MPKRDGGLVLRPGNGLVGEYPPFKFFLRFDEKILDTVATLVGHGNFVGRPEMASKLSGTAHLERVSERETGSWELSLEAGRILGGCPTSS